MTYRIDLYELAIDRFVVLKVYRDADVDDDVDVSSPLALAGGDAPASSAREPVAYVWRCDKVI